MIVSLLGLSACSNPTRSELVALADEIAKGTASAKDAQEVEVTGSISRGGFLVFTSPYALGDRSNYSILANKLDGLTASKVDVALRGERSFAIVFVGYDKTLEVLPLSEPAFALNGIKVVEVHPGSITLSFKNRVLTDVRQTK